jgi:hypothetical protein
MIKRSISVLLTAGILAMVAIVPASHSASLTLTSGQSVNRTTPANLITNGSFETGGPGVFWATGTLNVPYSALPGWASGGGVSNYAQWDNTATNHNSDPLPDGTQGLYFGNAFVTVVPAPTYLPSGEVTFSSTPAIIHISPPPANFMPDVTLSQTISGLNVNQVYVFSFWASGESPGSPNGYATDGVFAFDVTGFPTTYLAVPHGGTGGIGSSKVYQFLVQPANATTTFTFTNWGHLIDAAGVGSTELVLDDVVLNAVAAEACCIPGAICQILSGPDCLARGGLYAGDGTACGPNGCGPTPTESQSWGQIKARFK